jgi:hypothetical protein
VQEVRELHLPGALKEGRHKWNPSVERDCRCAALEGNIFLASRTAREDQDEFTLLQNADGGLDRTWRRVRAINRNAAAVLQDPS